MGDPYASWLAREVERRWERAQSENEIESEKES